jgi:septal ring factor EnvC (AmiA/AmiB activator)
MNPTIVAAIFAASGGVIVALISGMYTLVAKNRDLRASALAAREANAATAGALQIQGWQEQRKDTEALRLEVRELRDEIRGLEKKLDESLESRRQIEAERDRLRTDAMEWREKYEREHALANLYGALYDYAVAGRVPDPAMLDAIQRELRALGVIGAVVAAR